MQIDLSTLNIEILPFSRCLCSVCPWAHFRAVPKWAGSRRLLLDFHPDGAAGTCMQNVRLSASSNKAHAKAAELLSLCTLGTAVQRGGGPGSKTKSVTYPFTNPGNGSLLGFETFCTRPTLMKKKKKTEAAVQMHFTIYSPYLNPHGFRSISPDVSMMPWEVFIYPGPFLYVWWVPVVGSVVLSAQVQQNGRAAPAVTGDKKGSRELQCRMFSPDFLLLPLLNLLFPLKSIQIRVCDGVYGPHIGVSFMWHQRWHLITLVLIKITAGKSQHCSVVQSTGVNKQTSTIIYPQR